MAASRPARARGLKHDAIALAESSKVAPRAGAWIETFAELATAHAAGRAPRGRVD